ncbi:MAG: hypothetical protein NXY57DRAFT_1085711 [Lentinula lateritia]|nr:MAG: hypothetical protein NXY57DRAFT_1085711 [Lentinula lateritia]
MVASTGSSRLTFATSRLTPVRGVKGVRVKILSHAYEAISERMSLRNNGDFRKKMGAEEEDSLVGTTVAGATVHGTLHGIKEGKDSERGADAIEVLAGSPSHHCLSALLNLPSPTSGSATSSSSTQNPAPSRSALLSSALSRNVLNLAPPMVQKLYHALEVDFDPSTLCESVAPLLEELGGASTSGASGASGMNGEDGAAIDDGYKPVQPSATALVRTRLSSVACCLSQSLRELEGRGLIAPAPSPQYSEDSAEDLAQLSQEERIKSLLASLPAYRKTLLLH